MSGFELLMREQTRALRIAKAVLRNRTDAEECVSAVMEQLVHKDVQVEGDGIPWLFCVVRNRARTMLRKRRVRRELSIQELVGNNMDRLSQIAVRPSDHTPLWAADLKDERNEVRHEDALQEALDAIQQLRHIYRVALSAFVSATRRGARDPLGISAQLCGCSRGTFIQRIHRAREILQRRRKV